MTAEQLAYLRLLIADTDFVGGYVYEDQDLDAFYTNEGSVKAAAARALEVYAANIAQLAGPVRGLLDIRVGGEQSAQVLLTVARRYRSGGGRVRTLDLSNFAVNEEAV